MSLFNMDKDLQQSCTEKVGNIVMDCTRKALKLEVGLEAPFDKSTHNVKVQFVQGVHGPELHTLLIRMRSSRFRGRRSLTAMDRKKLTTYILKKGWSRKRPSRSPWRRRLWKTRSRMLSKAV